MDTIDNAEWYWRTELESENRSCDRNPDDVMFYT